MIILQPRKKCESCGNFLICFQGCYLHPSTPCAGIKDTIRIEAEVMDEALWKKWKELYGDPQMDDYERVEALEIILEDETAKKSQIILDANMEVSRLREENNSLKELLNHPWRL